MAKAQGHRVSGYDISDEASWLETAKTLTGGTSAIVVTVTNATTVHATGIVIIDLAGYFTSRIGRGGANYVTVKRGFTVDVIEVQRAIGKDINFGPCQDGYAF